MAKSVVAFELRADGNQAEGSVKSLKAQLREAQADVQTLSDKFGATSQEAIKAAQRAAELKDAIGDAKALTDAFNPDRKFQAFSGALQSVVGGFAALQGAQALFGSESEELEKVLVKVQAAMALSQGINSILEARDSFKILGTVAINALNGIRTAIGSTGIGLLAVAIGGIVMAMKDWYNSTQNQISAEELLKQKEEALGNEIKNTNDEIENRNRLSDYLTNVELTNAKARGASVEELRKIQDKAFNEEAIKRQEALDRELTNFAEIEKSYSKDSKIYKDALAQKDKIANDYYTFNQKRNQELANRQLEDYNKDVAKNKEKVDKIIAENKRIADANAAQNDLQKKLQDEITLSLIANERDRAATKLEMDLEDAKKEIENGKATTKEKNESIALLEQQYMINLRQMKDTWAQEDKEKKDKQTEQELEDEKNRQEKFNQLRQEGLQNALKIEEDFANAKQGIRDAELNAVSTGISILGQLGEKNKAIQKVALIAENAVAIARTVIAANQSILETRAKANAIPAFIGPGIPNPSYIAAQLLATKNILSTKINAATSIASIVAATAKGLGALGGGSGGGGGTVGGGGGGGTQANAPLTPQAQTTSLNQGQINQLASATTRAFVLESDVSGNQERIRRINRAARIN